MLLPSSAIAKEIDELFNPHSIAVVGASENPLSFGYHFVRYLQDYGYKGAIYPVTPKSTRVLGYRSYASLSEIPDPVDYVICCINASLVKDLLHQCSRKNVKVVHLFTGRLSETGDREAEELEREIGAEAARLGIRLIGPNCLGLYYPKKGLAFNYDLALEPGALGAIIQSGGIAGELARHAALKGVRFSKIISYGNAVDLNECDFLDYFLWDEETKIVVLYIEGVRDGRRFREVLSRLTSIKPVIILKGGSGQAGVKAVASHTASLAGSTNTWQVVFRQSGAVQASNFNELIDLTVAFYFLPPITGKRVGIAGGGGGRSVLSADECEEAGLDIIPLPARIVKFLEGKSPLVAKWLVNPVDFSLMPGVNINSIEVLKIMAEDPDFDLILTNVTEDSPLNEKLWIALIEREIEAYLTIAREKQKPIAVIMGNPDIGIEQAKNWRWETLLKQRERLINAGIPVFASMGRAARAVNKMVDYYCKWGRS